MMVEVARGGNGARPLARHRPGPHVGPLLTPARDRADGENVSVEATRRVWGAPTQRRQCGTSGGLLQISQRLYFRRPNGPGT
jgi:hypothetical protein